MNAMLAYFDTPRAAWDAMYADCAKAVHSIDFEQYILKDDSAGLRFLELFRDKAKAGIRIRLILDRIGSRSLFASKIVSDIERVGGRVHFYNSISPMNFFTPKLWFPRNHSKLMLVDRDIAYVGSVCVSAEMAEWRDLHARIEDAVAKDNSSYFDHLWSHDVGRWRRKERHRAAKRLRGTEDIAFIAAQSRLRSNALYRELLHRIGEAQNRILLATPYFMPPFLLRHALYHAAARGVEVKVLMSARSDVPVADYVAQSYFSRLIERGFKICLFRDSVFHAKYAVIDDSWATMGSTNMDYLSLLRNREANIVLRAPAEIKKLTAQFTRDEESCFLADEEYCRLRPFTAKLVGRLARPLKQFL
jgi:cardiolipin synthase A/B